MIHLVNANDFRIPSLALATLKVFLNEEQDRPVSYFDTETKNAEAFERFAVQVDDHDLVGFTVVSYNIKGVLEYCRILRRANAHCRIVLGGPMVSSQRFSLSLLENHPEIDFIVRGRANDTFPQLLRLPEGCAKAIDRELDICNVTYRLKGVPFAAPDARQTNDRLKALSPWLLESDYLLGDYLRYAQGPLPYSTGYGCPNGCTYCVESQQQFVLYPLDRVKQELGLILSSKPESMFLYDSTFGYNRRRAAELMAFVAEQNRGTQIGVYVDLEQIDEAYCQQVRRANVVFNGVGLQTTNKRTCSNLRRPAREAKEIRSRVNADLFQRHAAPRVSLIYGLPGEGFAEFKETLNFALSLRSNHNLGVYRYCYYPGTYLYEQDLAYRPRSETDPEIVCGSAITEAEVRRCNRVASFYWVLTKTFPFTLMLMAHLDGRDRVGIIERFGHGVWRRLSADSRATVEDIAFANREAECTEELKSIVQAVVQSPAPYCHELAEALAGETATARTRRVLARWLALDVRCRSRLRDGVRRMIESRHRLSTFVAGLTGSDEGAREQPVLHRVGRWLAASPGAQELCLQAAEALAVVGKTAARGVRWTAGALGTGLRLSPRASHGR